MLSGVDPALLQSTLDTQLKFNSNYYRIYTPREIEEAEQMAGMLEESKSAGLIRKYSQKAVSFPAMPDEINREMLTPLNPQATDDSDNENDW